METETVSPAILAALLLAVSYMPPLAAAAGRCDLDRSIVVCSLATKEGIHTHESVEVKAVRPPDWDLTFSKPGNLAINASGPAIISSDARDNPTNPEEWLDIKTGRLRTGSGRNAIWYAPRWDLGILDQDGKFQAVYSWDAKPKQIAFGATA